MKNNVLFFGPYPPPLTGQSIAFKTFVDNIDHEKKTIVNSTKFGEKKIRNSFYAIYISIAKILSNRYSAIYFTCSRSKHGFLKELPLLLLSRLFRIKIINHLHGNDFQQFYENSGPLKPLITYCYNGIETSIVLMEEMKKEFVSFPNMKLQVVHNCYGHDFDETKRNSIKQPKKIHILYLSNLLKSKGILEFLDAAENICSKRNDIKFVIAGKPMGDQFWKVEEIKKSFNVKYNKAKKNYPEQIDYLGTIKGAEKLNELIKASIFVLPTYYPTEAFPISIIEAMRCGCAIITTNHNLLPNIIKPENGLLVEKQSSSAIVTAINNLLSNKKKLKKIQEYNMNFAKQNYSPEKYTSELKNIVFSIS